MGAFVSHGRLFLYCSFGADFRHQMLKAEVMETLLHGSMTWIICQDQPLR